MCRTNKNANLHRLAFLFLESKVLASTLAHALRTFPLTARTPHISPCPSRIRLTQFVPHVLDALPGPRSARQTLELPHQVIRNLEGGIRIVRIDLGAGLIHPHDKRGITLGDLVGDDPGHQFGGATLANDHQAPCN